MIAWPLMRTDKGCHCLGMVDDIALDRPDVWVLSTPDKQAKRAGVVLRSVVVHGPVHSSSVDG